ncbi:MAG: ribonuclease HII [bacterium]
MREIEESIWQMNYQKIGGIDEVGRGPLAGPVISSVVVVEKTTFIEGVKDSKKLSAKKREYFFEKIKESCIDIGIGSVDEETIDQINIYQATILSMKKALNNLKIKPDFILVDGLFIPDLNIPQKKIIKGDNLCFSIASASIIAKVTRDRYMDKMHEIYPQYNFKKNKGYGTFEHLEVLNIWTL